MAPTFAQLWEELPGIIGHLNALGRRHLRLYMMCALGAILCAGNVLNQTHRGGPPVGLSSQPAPFFHPTSFAASQLGPPPGILKRHSLGCKSIQYE